MCPRRVLLRLLTNPTTGGPEEADIFPWNTVECIQCNMKFEMFTIQSYTSIPLFHSDPVHINRLQSTAVHDNKTYCAHKKKKSIKQFIDPFSNPISFLVSLTLHVMSLYFHHLVQTLLFYVFTFNWNLKCSFDMISSISSAPLEIFIEHLACNATRLPSWYNQIMNL